MSPLEHSGHHVQQCLAAAAATIANDQNQLTAAVRGAREQLQAAAKKLEDARTAHGRVAIAAAAAPNINIHDCASAARVQRDDLLSLAGQLQELAEFLTVICTFFDFASSPLIFELSACVSNCQYCSVHFTASSARNCRRAFL